MKKVVIRFLIVLVGSLLVSCTSIKNTPDLAGESMWGYLEGNSIVLTSITGGKVSEVLVEANQQVTADQILIQLDSSILENARTQALADIVQSQAGLDTILNTPAASDLAKAQAAVDIANADVKTAEASLEILKVSYLPASPPSAQLHNAESDVRIAKTSLALAQAMLAQVQAGPNPEQITLARTRLAYSQANLKFVETQISELSLKAPVSSKVSQTLVKPGEIAFPGSPLIILMTPEELTITVYIPVKTILQTQIGDQVKIIVDALPGQPFRGRVIEIEEKAQFTPPSIQTTEERAKTVFAVKIQMETHEPRLKPGMSAEVVFD